MESGVPSPIDGVVAEILAQGGQATFCFEEKVGLPGEKTE